MQIHRELEEAAFVAGLSTARTAWRVLFPLIRPTLFSVWIWSALLVYRELTAAVFLAVHDNITLPAVIWSYWYSGNINKASAVTLLMTLVLDAADFHRLVVRPAQPGLRSVRRLEAENMSEES